MRVRSPKDFWAGVMFAGVGLFFSAWSLAHYEMGTTTRMGPGYFPVVLGGLLALLGVVILARALVLPGPAMTALHLRPLLLVTASVVAYGYFMRPLGLVLATVVAVVVVALGGSEFRWKEATIVSVALAALSVLVFVKGLGLPFPICPEFIERCPVE